MLYICKNFEAMRFFKKHMALLFSALLAVSLSYSQTGFESALAFKSTVHNFGKISIDAGEQHCTFEFTNISDKPVVINNVISSCGCAQPEWPRQPIMPGEGGKIEVTYLNDQGPYPFEKNITVYTSASRKPVILRISGIAYEKEKSLKELFPVAVGPLGIMKNNIGAGQIEQGCSKSGSISVANFSQKAVSVQFDGLSAGLALNAVPKVLEPGAIGEIRYEINTGEALNWGNTTYSANVVCNGERASVRLNFNCMIIDNVSGMSAEQKNSSSMILAKNSSVTLEAAKGAVTTARFSLRNTGAADLVIHKADTNGDSFEVTYPEREIKPGENFEVAAKIKAPGAGGEKIYTITLITNSPKRPLVNLFVALETK